MLRKFGVLVPVALIGLSGCSKGPSDGDVKASLSKLYEACEFAKVEDVKVQNRMETGERTYQVKASLSLVVPPLPSIREEWQQYETAKARAKELREQHTQVLEQSRTKYDPLIDAADEEKPAIEYSEEHAEAYQAAWREIMQKRQDLRERRGKEEDAALLPINEESGQVQRTITKLQEAMDREIGKAVASCRVEGVAKQMLYQSVGSSRLDFFGKGNSQGFTYEFAMMKTDAGWVAEL